MLTRRKLMLAMGAGGLSVSLPALAQTDKRVRRVGFFSGGSVQSTAAWLAAFRQGMAELRWVEGRDYVIEARHANGVLAAEPVVAAELLATQPDVVLAPADRQVRILAERTKTIPIVFAIAQDPVGNGSAKSLQRPGGNATGVTNLARELGAKRLQLLKEAFPSIVHVVVLFERAVPGNLSQVKDIQEAAARLKVRITPIEVRQGADIEPAFKRGTALGAQAYMLTTGALFSTYRQAIVDRIKGSKAIAIFLNPEFVDAGGLMAYGPSSPDNFRRAAAYVDKILKGEKPGELPIEQPVKFELVINLKTAKAMGFSFPESFLVRADRVIE